MGYADSERSESGGNASSEVGRKDAEMLHQEELADRAKEKREGLGGYDKTVADSFPTSDPPQQP